MKNLTNAIRTTLAAGLLSSGLFCQHAQADQRLPFLALPW